MTIKVLEKAPGCFPVQFEQGDWYDLCLAENITLKAPEANKMHIRGKDKNNTGVRTREVTFNSTLARLGVAMEIPEGYEAVVIPRSSTFKKYGIIQSNSMGLIDASYKGDKDEWCMPMVATKNVTIPSGTRVAQFRIQLSQKATSWQRIKWIFSGAPKLKKVYSLDNPSRGGFGSTGEN